MRTTLKHSLAACIALSALMLTGTACTDHDDLRNNAGTQLLALGEVTVAGTDVAGTTRAAIEQDLSTGFTGIRKTLFVANDELALTLSSSATTTAKLVGTAWTLADRTYYTPNTKLTATYTPAVQPGSLAAGVTGGIRYADVLTATTGTLPTDGTKLALTLTHANALIEVTPPDDVTDGTYTIALSATPAGSTAAAEELGIAREEGAQAADLRYRTIAPADATLSTISLKVNGMTYTTALTQKVEANKRYPITLRITKDKLVATVGASDLNWGAPEGFDGRPGGYTRYIYTADDLAAFSTAVNSGDTKATTATVLQMADIDLAGREWTPIGTGGSLFRGKYNGNGHTISNLTISNGPTYSGLFGAIRESHITGVHLRNCSIVVTTATNARVGALVGYVDNSNIITLCSATGTVEASGSNPYAGGLIGRAASNTAAPSHITRCSADVAVTMTSTNTGYVGGLVGYTDVTYYAGCIASGKVHKKKNSSSTTLGTSSGFSNTVGTGTDNYNAFGCITNCEIVNDDNAATSAFGTITMVRSCIATKSYGNFYINSNAIGNVCLGALTTSQSGVTPNADLASAHAKLINATNLSYYKMKTLHYSKEEGYTLKLVEGYHFYAKDLWKDNGTALPTINMTYEGSPAAITPANRVYTVNGYFVTAPEAETTTYAWNASTSADAMASDPCAAGAANGWRMPTMKDFEAMAGWSIDYPWSQSASVGNDNLRNIADAANFNSAFPTDKNYWSSVPNTNTDKNRTAWCLAVRNTPPQAVYGHADKSSNTNNYVRCVQEQKTTP